MNKLRSILLLALTAAAIGAQGRAESSRSPSNTAMLDLPGYLAVLDRCSAAAARLEEHPAEAAALRNSLPGSWSITIGGQTFDVSADWLREKLDAFPRIRSKESLVRGRF
jgi:hypothetical protein